MLLVHARKGPSKIHGLGLIARELIPKGTRIWAYRSGFDLTFTPDQLLALPPPAREQVLYYSYFDPRTQLYVMSSDDDRFINDSNDNPNVELDDDGDSVRAARDILPGEELTWNYDTWYERLRSSESPAPHEKYSPPSTSSRYPPLSKERMRYYKSTNPAIVEPKAIYRKWSYTFGLLALMALVWWQHRMIQTGSSYEYNRLSWIFSAPFYSFVYLVSISGSLFLGSFYRHTANRLLQILLYGITLPTAMIWSNHRYFGFDEWVFFEQGEFLTVITLQHFFLIVLVLSGVNLLYQFVARIWPRKPPSKWWRSRIMAEEPP